MDIPYLELSWSHNSFIMLIPRLAVTAGVHLRKDFGGRGIYRTYPLFSVKYQHGNSTLVNGVLEGNTHHRMLDPIYDFEKKITEPVEYGTQFIINSKKFISGCIH
jgi:hypothetical protein